ncbi:MAG: AEC family transporter [Oscillospiraceae bacterium]|nr:AEC family transporter [Oscillospiraceae bacterium]
MISKLLIYKSLQLFSIMIIGFIITKLKIIRYKDSLVLSKLSLYVLMPSAIINAFDFQKSEQMRNGLLLAFLAAIIIHVVFYLLDILYSRYISNNSVERASIMYSNAGNLIIPIVSFVLGNEWVVFSTAYLSVQLLFLWSHGIQLFSSNEKFNIKKVLFNVNIIAIASGLVMMIFGWRLPTFVKDITSSFGDMLGTVGMLIAGILAANIDFKKILADKRIYRVIFVRMVAYPFITLFILKLLSLISVIDGEKILLISFLASITPSAATVMQFAQINNNDSLYATAINILTTIVCVLTMPLFVMLFNYV